MYINQVLYKIEISFAKFGFLIFVATIITEVP